MGQWLIKVAERARDTIQHFEDSIVEELEKGNSISRSGKIFGECVQNHIQDYSGSVSLNCHEAVDVLTELDDYEVNDDGLWAGKDMLGALQTCATLTFARAVEHFVNKIFDSVECDDEIGEYDSLDDDDKPQTKKEYITARLQEIISEELDF